MGSITYTTLAAWPLAVCQALESRSIDPAPLLLSAGLDRLKLAAHPDGRVDIHKMTQFWQAVEHETNDESFGLSIAPFVQPMHFRALGMFIQTTSNVEETILKLGQYAPMISNSVVIKIEHSATSLGFCVRPVEGLKISSMAIDGFFAVMNQFIGLLSPPGAFVDKVEFMRKTPSDPERWDHHFKTPVIFGSDQNILWLNRVQLKNCITIGDSQLSAMNESMVKAYVDALQRTPFSHQVTQFLAGQLDNEELDFSVVSAHLNLSERSLRRNLKAEGTTYRDLVHASKMNLAERYLIQTELSITQIALHVGFTDTSNFSRAFTRCFGKSPSEFRAAVR